MKSFALFDSETPVPVNALLTDLYLVKVTNNWQSSVDKVWVK